MIKKQLFTFLIFMGVSTFGFSQSSTEESLKILITKKREYNKNTKHGYCVQLYNGNENSAIKHMENFSVLFPDIAIKRIYKVPEWKVQTTSYKTKIEADRVLNSIKDVYPGARVL